MDDVAYKLYILVGLLGLSLVTCGVEFLHLVCVRDVGSSLIATHGDVH